MAQPTSIALSLTGAGVVPLIGCKVLRDPTNWLKTNLRMEDSLPSACAALADDASRGTTVATGRPVIGTLAAILGAAGAGAGADDLASASAASGASYAMFFKCLYRYACSTHLVPRESNYMNLVNDN